MFKFSRNTVTKVDLNNSTESLRLEINKRFEEVNRRFEEVNRQFEEVNRRFEEAAEDREKIRIEMSIGFAEAAASREKIRDEARDQWKAINAEMIRHNQNYIEHLSHHNTQKANPVLKEDDST